MRWSRRVKADVGCPGRWTGPTAGRHVATRGQGQGPPGGRRTVRTGVSSDGRWRLPVRHAAAADDRLPRLRRVGPGGAEATRITPSLAPHWPARSRQCATRQALSTERAPSDRHPPAAIGALIRVTGVIRLPARIQQMASKRAEIEPIGPVLQCSVQSLSRLFTMALHPDVGEGAGPLAVRCKRAFLCLSSGRGPPARMPQSRR